LAVSTANAPLLLDNGMSAYATDPILGTGTAETWHTLGTLTGYAVAVARYRKTTSNEVEIDIQVSSAAGNAASAAFSVALPAAYRPLNDRYQALGSSKAVAAGDVSPRIVVTASAGVITVFQTSAVTAQLGGTFRIPLD